MTLADGRDATRLAQANQRLAQEQAIFARKLDRDKEFGRLQICMGWIVAVMLPLIGIVCVIVFFNYDRMPSVVVAAASSAFFVDVLGTVLAGYKSLMPSKPKEELLTAVTRDPFEIDPASNSMDQ